jgi:hypothetical protein
MGKYDLMLFLVTFVLANAIVSILMSHYAYGFDRSKDIAQQLRDPKNIISGNAILLVYSDSSWSGTVMDTTFSSATDEGFGDKRVEFACSSGGVYSIVFQNHDSSGYLLLAVLQNGKLLNTKSTVADYGVVSLSGRCD